MQILKKIATSQSRKFDLPEGIVSGSNEKRDVMDGLLPYHNSTRVPVP